MAEKPKLFVVTSNEKKLNDFKRILGDNVLFCDPNKLFTRGGKKVELVEIQSSHSEEVLAHKLKQLHDVKLENGLYFVEDTSMFIAGLKDYPGPHIKHFYSGLGPQRIVDYFGGSALGIVSGIGVYNSVTGETKMFFGKQDGFILKQLDIELLQSHMYDFDCIISNAEGGKPFALDDTRTFRTDALHLVNEYVKTVPVHVACKYYPDEPMLDFIH